jgi:hypothetical protein
MLYLLKNKKKELVDFAELLAFSLILVINELLADSFTVTIEAIRSSEKSVGFYRIAPIESL